MSSLDSATVPPTAEKKQPITTDETIQRAPSRAESATGVAREEAEPLSKNVIFDILRNQRRRKVMEYLREHPTTTVSDLAEHIAAVENGIAVEQLSSTERKRVYVGLYQCHLPRMSDADVITYRQARGIVTLRAPAAQLFPHLDLDPTRCSGKLGAGRGRVRTALAALASKLRH